MKKVLIISFLIFTILISYSNIVLCAEESKTNSFSNTPNATAYKLSIKNTVTEKVNVGTTQETTVDYLILNNFVVNIPSKLKAKGYTAELTNNNSTLNIASNDNSYNCKIAMFSDVTPYKLTQEQVEELVNISDKLAAQACTEKGISKEDENYYDVFYNEYVKIDASYEEVAQFYSKHNINRFTFFNGFTNLELHNAWKLLGVDPNNIGSSSRNETEDFLITTFRTDSRTSEQLEISNNSTKGLFLQTHTYNTENIFNDYKVEVDLIYDYYNEDSNTIIQNSIENIQESINNTEPSSNNLISEQESVNKVINSISKLPQTGKYFELKDGLYILCISSFVALVYIILKAIKYNNIEK